MPIPLRTDFDATALRATARTTKGGPQAQRCLALAAIPSHGHLPGAVHGDTVRRRCIPLTGRSWRRTRDTSRGFGTLRN